jgi:predicted aspartyl protease
VLERIDISIEVPHIAIGSLVKTDKGFLFVSVALGKIIIDDSAVIVLSPQSPLGQKLIGLHANESAEINGVRYLIETIS